MAIEEPSYSVVSRNDSIEIREYQPYVVVETYVEAGFESAGNEGFRRLFRYITGANAGGEEISMTAPVAQQAGTEIAMTAPVGQLRDSGGHWVSFMVPSQYSFATAPRPTEPRVRLRQVPAQLVAAIRYSGFWSERRFAQEKGRLEAFMSEAGLEAAGEPQIARYDAPYVPPFMRRNEILIPLAAGSDTE